jgi:hypothetical protein
LLGKNRAACLQQLKIKGKKKKSGPSKLCLDTGVINPSFKPFSGFPCLTYFSMFGL